MNPVFHSKASWEKRRLIFDPAPAMAVGDELESIFSYTIYDENGNSQADMFDSVPTIIDDKVIIVLKGGTPKATYSLILRLKTVDGDWIEDDLKILIRETPAV